MRKGFSLIELLVVIAIIGVLAAIGLTSYNSFLDEARTESTLTSDTQINRAINQDYISISNNLSGTTDLVGTTSINSDSTCYDYLQAAVAGINQNYENAYNNAIDFAINLHISGTTMLKPGQMGMQCANVCASFNQPSYFFMRCTCTETDCNLDNFVYGDADAITYSLLSDSPANPTDLFFDSDGDGTISLGDPMLVGPEIPEGYCPIPQTTFIDGTVKPVC